MDGEPQARQTPQMITREEMQDIINSRDATGEKSEEVQRKLEAMRYGALAEVAKKKDESPARYATLLGAFGVSPQKLGMLLVAFIAALLWAFFYYPMALTIAGYTQDFKSVINPVVGLDTMRRMGGVYVKAFLFYLCVQLISFGVNLIVRILTAPFDMPFFGNLPASFIGGVTTFYFNLVIACLLGLALHKCADKLDIPVD